MKDKIINPDQAITVLQMAVDNAISKAQAPIRSHIKYLRDELAEQTKLRDGIDSKRTEVIAKLSTEQHPIKSIIKLKTDYHNAVEGVDIVKQAIDLATKSLTTYQPVNHVLSSIVRTATIVLHIKKLRAQNEVVGRATTQHDKQIDAELNSMHNHSKHLIKMMEDLKMDDLPTGKALVAVVRSLIAFAPGTTNPTESVDIDDGLYIPDTNNKLIKEAIL